MEQRENTLVSKGVMGQAQTTHVQLKYLKFFSLKRCSKGGKQQSKTNPDNPKICPSVTIKDFNKGARKTPKRRTYCNELFSVTGEEKAPVFNTADRKTSRHWSQLFFFFLKPLVPLVPKYSLVARNVTTQLCSAHKGKKVPFFNLSQTWHLLFFLAVLKFLYCETAIKNKVKEKSFNIRHINQNYLKLSFEAF